MWGQCPPVSCLGVRLDVQSKNIGGSEQGDIFNRFLRVTSEDVNSSEIGLCVSVLSSF